MSQIRTRFAPSPTGNLHIGSVRTALFSYLYARSQGGQFLVRIEDTDKERSKPEFEHSIKNDLIWLGLKNDGEIIRQSERLEIYRRYATQLINEGKACRIDQETSAVKFTIQKKKIIVHDLVHGDVEFDASLFDDVVIVKSDGMPTYNFACVVDDHEQEITHVIRGDDHLSNTPRQWLIYEALGWKPPKVAHIPLIIGSDRTPLSKRHGDVSLEHYRRAGFLPQGLLNYLALMGWSPGGNQEFLTLAEMEKKFKLSAVGKTSTIFDEKKMAWLNACHLKTLSETDYLQTLCSYVDKVNCLPGGAEWTYVEKVALLYKSRIQIFQDLSELAGHCFEEKVTLKVASCESLLTSEAKARMKKLHERLLAVENFEDAARLEVELRDLAVAEHVTAADFIHPARLALTGHTVSPGIFELMKVLGKERVCDRLLAFSRS